jgi:antibiotic biosynthesis monooxygenase (ABM) superfamily enzyme
MEHDGVALAADETNHRAGARPGLISVHIRALITWISICPLAMAGMFVEYQLVPTWPIPFRALALTAVVVPLSVYVVVPRLLLLVSRMSRARASASI